MKIYLSPLHIKLGLMKNFVKSVDITGKGFTAHLKNKFPRESDTKNKRMCFHWTTDQRADQ